MWTVIPLSQIGTWDGNCIYKIKDGSRRCKLSAGADTDVRRFGNRNELRAKISRGVSLTSQEESELAQGLCCLRWHSTKDIAREICALWARVPATVLVPMPSHQNEIQKLKKENEMLTTRLQTAKALEKRYYESWVDTFPQFKSFKAEIEELKKILEETRQVEKVPEDGNEFLTTRFGSLSKGTFGVPAATAETSIRVTPPNHTIMSKSKLLANRKVIPSYSFGNSNYLGHVFNPDLTFSAKKAYSTSPTHLSRASSSDSLIRVENGQNGHKDLDLATPELSCLTASSTITAICESTKSPLNAALNINKLSPISCNVTSTLASTVLMSTTSHDRMGPLEVSPSPMGGLLEKLVKIFLGVFIFFCWAGNLSFVQFTGVVLWTSVVVWTQVGKEGFQEIQQKYYSEEDVVDEYKALDQAQ